MYKYVHYVLYYRCTRTMTTVAVHIGLKTMNHDHSEHTFRYSTIVCCTVQMFFMPPPSTKNSLNYLLPVQLSQVLTGFNLESPIQSSIKRYAVEVSTQFNDSINSGPDPLLLLGCWVLHRVLWKVPKQVPWYPGTHWLGRMARSCQKLEILQLLTKR